VFRSHVVEIQFSYYRGGLGGISEFFVAREADRVGMPAEERREDFGLPHHPCLRIFSGWTRGFQATPEFFPRFRLSNIQTALYASRRAPFNPLQEIMLGEAREGEKAAPLRAPDCALEGSYVRTGLQVILVNADHPGHFRCPGRWRSRLVMSSATTVSI